MAGRYQYDIEIKTNVEKLLIEMKQAQDRLDSLEGKDYKIKLDIDTKTLESTIKKLDKMLDSIGKGTGDFKQFENLSKELSAITSEVQSLSKAFGKVDDSGAKSLLSSIQNIDKSLSKLSQNILNVNKNMSNIGNNTNSAVKQVENIGNAAADAAKQVDKLEKVQSKLGNKTNISLGDTKLDNAVSTAKELDKALEQVDIPTDSFDKVLKKLNLAKSELVDIVKITKQSVSDSDGKFHNSYTLKDSRGSTEIYGENSKTEKGQLLRSNIVSYDKKKDELDVSKAQLEIDKQLAKEEKSLAKAQLKQGQAFLKEQTDYEANQKKAEFIKKQTAAYNELINTINKYSEVAKRVSIGQAEDGDLELMTKLEDKISQLQKQPILSDSQVAKSEKSLVSLYDQLDKIEKKTAETNQKSQDKLLNNYDKRIESYKKKQSNYDVTLKRFEDGGWASSTYKENVSELKNYIDKYRKLLDSIKDGSSPFDEDNIKRLNDYESSMKKIINTIQNMSAAEKGMTQLSKENSLKKIKSLLEENSNMARKARDEIKALYDAVDKGQINGSAALGKVQKIVNDEIQTGRGGKSMLSAIKEKAWYGVAGAIGTYFGFDDIVNGAREAASTVIELDDALIDLKKTTSMTSSELKDYYFDSNDVAKQMGVTTQEIIEQSAEWSRLGYSTKEQATEMAKLSSQFASISPGMDVSTGQQGLVSIMKAWSINPDQVKSEIMDPINRLGNTMSESNQDIVEGMERSAAALAAVGTSTKDAFAMFSGIQEVLQNAEKSGTALRSVALRIRSFDEDTGEYSSDLENITGDLIDLTKTAEHSKGVSIFKDGSTTEFKSLVQYFGEIHDIWNEMTEKQQNDYLIKAFGRTQAQAGAALIQNYQGVTKALEEMDKAADSSDKEMMTVQESLSYKANALKETWTGIAQNLVDRGALGNVIDLLTKLSNVVDFATDKFGLFKTAALGVGAGITALGKGEHIKINEFIKFQWCC